MRDIIHHTTTTHLSFWDRVKALFGRPVIVRSEIIVDVQTSVFKDSPYVIVRSSESTPSVPPLIPCLSKSNGEVETNDQEPSAGPGDPPEDSEYPKWVRYYLIFAVVDIIATIIWWML